jgi:pimeloyl-ACP methyl ester carboxylesterase
MNCSVCGRYFGIIVLASLASLSAATTSKLLEVAGGVSLHVVEAGNTSAGATLVFIPGWSADAAIWSQQIEHFAQGNRVISFEPRSQGKSSKTKSGNTPEMRAQDLHALLERLHAHEPVLVGWSQGVQDIAAYVERYGTKELAGIVLVDAAISDGADGMMTRAEETTEQFRMFAIYQEHQQEYLHGMWQAIASKPLPTAERDRLIATGMKTPPSIGIAQLVADMFGVNRMPVVTKVECPALIIASGKSFELNRQKAIAEKISGAHFEKIEDAAHAVFLDQPKQFEKLLADFLATLNKASKT